MKVLVYCDQHDLSVLPSDKATCACLGEVDFGFGFDYEEGVGVGVAGVAEFLAGFVEGIGQDGEEDFAFGAADEIEAALLLDELELGRHAALACAR